ncbi:MAG TPA: spermidine/putrescine ABC transporter substrate-binding protein [Gammaproteobacteria bacterium]|nr:spermidine/putrescine ABC transporter substrate-binding protein [Gammaproteobacteria bacterium]
MPKQLLNQPFSPLQRIAGDTSHDMRQSRRSFLAAVALLPLLPLYAKANGHPKTVNFLGCKSGVDAETLRKFRHRAELDVRADSYSDDVQFIAKFLGGEPRYDVAMAPDDSISHLLQTELLGPLDRSLLPNAGLLDPAIPVSPDDPERNYSLPYFWGTLGIGYRKAAFREPPESWGVLLESGKHANRIALLSDRMSTLQIAQKYLGHSINTHTAEIIDEATQLLMKQKPRIKRFTSKPVRALLSGEADLVMLWSDDFYEQLRKSDDFGFTTPVEGTIVRQKMLCIPKHAADPVAAHRFINFLLDKNISAALARKFHHATANRAAAELLGESYRNHPALSPPSTVLKRSECRHFIHDAGQNRLYLAAWKKIMEQQQAVEK